MVNRKHKASHGTKNLRPMVFACLFAAFTAAISPLKIPLPFTPVPITLQTFAVLLSGSMLGPLYGALAMLLYLIVGALGIPVFAGGGSGYGALLGPTGGYLFSYPIAAFAVGIITASVKKKQLQLAANVFAMLAGSIIIYAMGATWGRFSTGLPWSAIFAGWVLPFLIGDAIKLVIAAYLASTMSVRRYLR